ncbi:MAG: hypothetical protein WA056_06145 [Gallionella sp.]
MKRLANTWLEAASVRCAQLCGFSSTVPLLGCLHWSSRRLLRTLGRPGVLAIGILVVFPPFYFSAVVPAQERLEEARRSTLLLREQVLHAGKSSDRIRRTPGEQLVEFYRSFPEERYSPQWLEKLAALAEKNGLSLNEGEYKATRDNVGRLMRLHMMFPVKGEYQQIRGFLTALHGEIPGIALESVQFTRQNVADATVEARIGLVLYLEQAS